jgi:hypothetical protein
MFDNQLYTDIIMDVPNSSLSTFSLIKWDLGHDECVSSIKIWTCEVLTSVTMRITVIWGVNSYSLVEI